MNFQNAPHPPLPPSEHDPRYSSRWTNLADARLGTIVLDVSDDFFAPAQNLFKKGRGLFYPDLYTDRGKWMDGWESRRKRTEGHDWCVIKLGQSGMLRAFDIDTNHFLGNHPGEASVDIANSDCDSLNSLKWQELLPRQMLQPGSQNFFDGFQPQEGTHVRLNIYPDGGVARFRVYGDPTLVDPSQIGNKRIDLVGLRNGGKAIACSDMFFSSMNNIIYPMRGQDMGDGWETKRRRSPGHDWIILQLARPGKIEDFEVDTLHFKGNYPDKCKIEGVSMPNSAGQNDFEQWNWEQLLAPIQLGPDQSHHFKCAQSELAVTHIRLKIYPDGGVSRLRCWGRLA